jgi:glycine cleavage system regulatory protein
MQRALVMTVIGRDRPGLVGALAALVAAQGGNWLESRMSRLGGHFAGILRVQVAADKEAALTGSLKELEREGLTVVVHSDRAEREASATSLALLEVVGQDRPGIVHQISHALASHAVNVEELDSGCSSAAMSGESLFRARARLRIPETCNLARLRQELEKIAGDLIVDLTLTEVPAEPVTASSSSPAAARRAV